MTGLDRIHVVGASGSGTTTLAKALAERLDAKHLDTDDFFWLPTQPPYTTPRLAADRVTLLRETMAGVRRWMLSGSLMGWGDSLIPNFDLTVFLYTPPEIRIPRIEAREQQRYGARIEPGGDMHAQSLEFIEWARGYDRPDFAGRSLARHRAWLAGMPCRVLELDGTRTVEEGVAAVLAAA